MPRRPDALVFVVFLVAAALSPRAAAISATEGSLLTSLVANAASRDARFDVLTRDDVKNAVAVEADRQGLGCEESTCLAELAGALGARIVVYGSVGQLGEDTLLTLNLFDSDAASSGGRRVARGKTITELSSVVEATTTELLEGFLKKSGAAPDARVRLLVLDLEVRAGVEPPPPPPPPEKGPPVLGLAGIGTAVVGAVGVGVGVYFDVAAQGQDTAARKSDLTQKDASALFDARDQSGFIALTSYLVGGAIVTIGAGVALAGFVLE